MKTKTKTLPLPPLEPILIDAFAAGQLLARRALFTQMVTAGWIKPVVNRHKCKLYCISDVRACVERLKKEEVPAKIAPTRWTQKSPTRRMKR